VDVILERIKKHPEAGRLFDKASPLWVARAPGRLDVMGGIADYSGSLVLQRTIAEATFAAIQPTADALIEVVSVSAGRDVPPRTYRVPLEALSPGGSPLDYPEAQTLLRSRTENNWAAYVLGVFVVLMREVDASFPHGARILVFSEVPEGKGVASSAALEVAVMQAVTKAFNIGLTPEALATLCQKVENHVAGAPCGIMDQMTSACGEADSLLTLLCQPAELKPPVPVPAELALWGIDSGERHAVSGSDYRSVRTGAFMGLQLIQDWSGNTWHGYLANISPAQFAQEFMGRLPEQMAGAEFLARYTGTADSVTRVDPGKTYKIRHPTAHPVFENSRVATFRQLLLSPSSEEQRKRLGELMYESHGSYSECGLGSRGTDLIVDLVRREGASNGLYGARITGGGSGGTVAVIGRADAVDGVLRVTAEYENLTGHRPYVFARSSPGAARFGVVKV